MKPTILSLLVIFGLLGCGGGSKSSSSSTNNDKEYKGAATEGDFATFTINGNTLQYNVNGVIFGSQSGSANLTNLYGNFYQTTSTPTVSMMIANNIAIGRVPISSSSGNPYGYIVGVHNPTPPTISSISNRDYIFVHIDTTGSTTLHKLRINSDKTFTAQSIPIGISVNGCWTIDSGIIKAKNGSTYPNCSSYNGSSNDYNALVRPGSSRAGIIVDYVSGNGIGIGLEQQPLTNTDITGTYKSFYYKSSSEGFAKAVVNSSGNINHYNCTSSSCSPFPSNTGNIALNQDCLGNAINGVACATMLGGKKYLTFIDNVDNYYISVSTAGTPYRVEVGSK